MERSKRQFVEYLLGGLADPDRQAFEERYFREDSFFLDLEEAEAELISAYRDQRLSQADRERFERHYANSEDRQRRVAFTGSLSRTIEGRRRAAPAARHSIGFWRWIAMPVPALALLLVSFAGLGALVWWQQSSLPADQTARTPPVPQVAKPPAPVIDTPAKTSPAPRPISIPTLLLAPGIARGAAAGTGLVLSAETTELRIHLGLVDTGFARFRAHVERVEGGRVYRSGNLTLRTTASRKVAVLRLPARNLAAGDYLVRLEGATTASAPWEPLEDYLFRVQRER